MTADRRISQSLALLALAIPAVVSCGDRQSGIPPASLASRQDSGTVFADTGTSRAGQQVTLTEAARSTAGIALEEVRSEPAQAESAGLEVPGQIEFDPRRVALVSPRVAGRLERLLVVEGDRVRNGETVALLFSPAFVTAQQDLVQARRRSAALEGTPDAPGARALADAARQRLVLLGVEDSIVAGIERSGQVRELLPLAAPLEGSVLEAPAISGATVDVGTPIFKIADLSDVDAIAEVPERSLPDVFIGQRAWVRIAAFPGLEFAGRVERLSDALNPETRTVRAAIHVPNQQGRLRPGMFATIRLSLPLNAASGKAGARTVLTIPESAVLSDPEGRSVFVEVAPGTFERRMVEIASMAPPGSAANTSDRVFVLRGLRPGDRVVVRGAFTLKSELAKSAFEEEP